MRWMNRFHIRNKVLVFGLLMSTLPLLLLSYYLFSQVRGDLEENIKEKQTIVIKGVAGDINDEMELVFQQIRFLASVEQVEEHISLFYEVLHENESIEEIVLFHDSGDEAYKVSRFELDSVRTGKWLSTDQLHQLKLEGAFIDEVEFNAYGQPIMKVAVPTLMPDQGGEIAGVGVTIQLQKIIGDISSRRMEKEGIVYLIDDQDRIIAHQDYTQLWKPEEEKESGGKLLGVTTDVESLDWRLVMEQPYEEAYSPIYDIIEKGIIVVLVIIVMVSLMSIAAGLYFTKPIEKLQRAIKKFQRDQWTEPVRLNRNDEMGELAESFNEMSKELHEKSQSLLQEKERLNIIVNGIGAGLALVRSDYTVSWINPTLEGWLGKYEVNLPCFALFSSEDHPCYDCPIKEKEKVLEAEEIHRIVEKNGEKKIFRHRVYPLSHTMASDEKYLIVLEDITEQKEMEEKLIQTDKLSALGLMASSFAHEVNNPLATINVYAEDLLDRLEEEKQELLQSGEINQYLETIKENTDRCKRITRNLLNFSRKSEWTQKQVDVNEVIHNSIALVHYTFARQQIKLETSLASSIPPVLGDGLKLMQVFVNIIQNAVDAMENGGTLSILSEQQGQEVLIQIKDSGSGIPKEKLAKVFDPFYTTKPVGKGTGLGLSVCYGIIQQFGGKIAIDSKQGEGTTVSIRLPINSPPRT